MNAPADMTKMNGLGNTIIVADMRGRQDRVTPLAARALAQADITSYDQIMAVYDPRSPDTDFFIEIWNRDGSQAQACGNGTRCVVAWLHEQGQGECFSLETVGGIVRAWRLYNGLVTVDMGIPRCQWQAIPLAAAVKDTNHVALQCGPLADASVVSMGNPHAVFFVDKNVNDDNLAQYGSALECDPLFPERANISIARVTSPTHLELRTWERGAGLTRACGTAACASVVAACRRGLTQRQVTVTLPGGDLDIIWDENDHILMTGPAEYEFSGRFDPATGQYFGGGR